MDGASCSDTDCSSISQLKVSFGVKRKADPIQTNSNCLEDGHAGSSEDEESIRGEEAKRHKIDFMDNGYFPEDKSKKPREHVIPMKIKKDWRFKHLENMKKEGKLKPDDETELERICNYDVKKTSESCPDYGEDADYSAISIENFGLAVLRGCGWKEGEGIGLSNKKVVPLKVFPKRPRGIGIGFDAYLKNLECKGVGNRNDESKALKKLAYVKIVLGIYCGSYGIIQSIDEDNGSVIVQLSIGENNVRVNQHSVLVISMEEYNQNSKCINKREYEVNKGDGESTEYAETQACTTLKTSSRRDEAVSVNQKSKSTSGADLMMWVQSGLRVRCISKQYKKGKLFNEKLRVLDAHNPKHCIVEDSSGVVHYDFNQDWLETVIPKATGSRIMIVGGKWRGRPAIMEEKHRRKEEVVARILSMDRVIVASFDDVCEYNGFTYDD